MTQGIRNIQQQLTHNFLFFFSSFPTSFLCTVVAMKTNHCFIYLFFSLLKQLNRRQRKYIYQNGFSKNQTKTKIGTFHKCLPHSTLDRGGGSGNGKPGPWFSDCSLLLSLNGAVLDIHPCTVCMHESEVPINGSFCRVFLKY